MNVYTTRPIKIITNIELNELLKNLKITLSSHALDHLSIGQRKLFKEQELTNVILRETPRKIFLQENHRYAVYYRKRKEYLKIIIEIEPIKAVIISFMNLPTIPRIK